MGLSFEHLKANDNKVVVEREENIVVEQNSDKYIKRSRTIVREKYPVRAKQSVSRKSPSSKKRETNPFPLIVAKKLSLGKLQKTSDRSIDGTNSVEAEIEIILEAILKSNQSQERPNSKSIRAAYDRLGHLEASINHEINKLKQQRSELRMNISKQKNAKVIRQGVDGNKKVHSENERRGIADEKFSNRHQCVCTSPRYGGVEELSCRPRERTIASQIEAASPVEDRGAVGDHISINNIPNESAKLEQPTKNERNFDELKDILTAPDAEKIDNQKIDDQIVNYCYCHNNKVKQTCCNQWSNNNYYQDTGTAGAYYYNYYPNECYQVDPCSSPNYCYTGTTVTQPRSCRCSTPRRAIATCGRRRTDLDTDHFYSRSSSPTSKRNDDKCGKFDGAIKAELEKELKAQLKNAKEKERYKKRYKELCEKLREQERCERKMREEEKKRCQSADRQCSNHEDGKLRKKLFEKLQNEGTSKLIKLLDRYCDEKTESKKRNISPSDRCNTVRSREKICQITVRKCKPRQPDMVCPNPESVTMAKCYCPEYCIKKVECFDKKPSNDSEYSLETLQMLKKMKIKEYKAAKPKSPKTKSDKPSPKDKQYTDYINKYKRADKQGADADSITKQKCERILEHEIRKHREKQKQRNYCEEIAHTDCCDEDVLDYDEFRKEMDRQLGVLSPNERSTTVDSARTYIRCKDEETQAYCSGEDSINSPNKAKKALIALKEFLETFTKSCPKGDKELLDLQISAAEIMSKLAACKASELKNLKTCQTQTEFKGCQSICAGVQTSHHSEGDRKTKKAVQSLKEFLETFGDSCPKEDEELLDLQVKFAKLMSKLAACNTSELKNLSDCETEASFRKRESISSDAQNLYLNEEKNKAKKALLSLKEFLKTYSNSCPKGDEELLSLQVKAAEIISKLAACKASKLENMGGCETQDQSQGHQRIYAGAQPSCHSKKKRRSNSCSVSLNEFLDMSGKSCASMGEYEECLDTDVMPKIPASTALKMKNLTACGKQGEFKGRRRSRVQNSCHSEDERKAKKALASLNDFLDTFAKSCPKKDEELLDLQIIAAEAITKLAACKTSELENSKANKTQTEFKERENICTDIQTSCHGEGETKAKRALVSINEYLKTLVDSSPRANEELLDLQITATEVLSKIAACKATELKNLRACETQAEFKRQESMCTGVQTSYYSMDEKQKQGQYPCQEETELNLNLIIEEPPPLSHTTYEDEYCCSPLPQYVHTDIYNESYGCPDNKHLYDERSLRQESINCSGNYTSPQSEPTRSDRTCDITDCNDSFLEPISRSTLKDRNFTNCASSTIIENTSQGSLPSKPSCCSVAATSRDVIKEGKTFQERPTTPPLRSPCPSRCKSVTSPENATCYEKTYSPCTSAITTSRNNSPDRNKRNDSPNRCCFKDNQNIDLTSGTNLQDSPRLRGILKSAPSIHQSCFNKSNECRKPRSETTMICRDKNNRSMRTCEDSRSLHSQMSVCSCRSGHLSVCSNLSQQRKPCVKHSTSCQMKSKSQDTLVIPAFNNCPCMHGVYCDILDIYFKGKERRLKSCHLNST